MEANKTEPSLLVLQQDLVPLCLGIVIILTNLLTFMILAQSRRINFLIKVLSMNLAVTDLLTGVAILVDSFLSPSLPEFLCRPLLYLYCIGVIVSFITVTSLLAERFIAIFYPFGYQRIVLREKRYSVIVILSLWVSGALLSVLNYINGFQVYTSAQTAVCASYAMTARSGLATLTAIFISLIILNLVLYLLMFMKMYKLSHSIYPLNNVRSHHLYKYQARVLIKLSAVTSSFMLLYTPLIILNAAVVLNEDLAKSLLTWQSFAGFFILLNSLLNPFIFVWRFTECRYTFLQMLCYPSVSRREKYRNLKKQFVVSYLGSSVLTANSHSSVT